jgi:putative ABC transport system permease protein
MRPTILPRSDEFGGVRRGSAGFCGVLRHPVVLGYSVVSYGVATRTNEFGIRMALGARARDVVRLVLSGTFWTVGAGLLAGVLLSMAFDNVATRWLTESSRDPLILGTVTGLLLAVAAVGCLAPARRAAAIDPMDALRHE